MSTVAAPPRIVSHRIVCIIAPEDVPQFRDIDISWRCDGSHEHAHYKRNRVDALIQEGALRWVGMHRRIAVYHQARGWRKVYDRRGEVGEVLSCTMQWVAGG